MGPGEQLDFLLKTVVERPALAERRGCEDLSIDSFLVAL
jgi:hypothetical protein